MSKAFVEALIVPNAGSDPRQCGSKGEAELQAELLDAFIQAHKQVKRPAVVLSILPEGIPEVYRDRLIKSGATPLQGVTEAFHALTIVMSYNEKLRIIGNNFSMPKTLLLTAESIEQDYSFSLNEWEGKQAISAHGVRIPNGILVRKIDEKQLLTEGMTSSFVVKFVSRDIVHKTEVGGVSLFLNDEQEVRGAVKQMNENIVHFTKADHLFLIEEMIQNFVAELNIGLKWDDQFGLALVISMGGELVNLIHDSAVVLLPASRLEIEQALFSLKGIKLLQGFRGRSHGDIEAVIETAISIAKFAEVYAENILEMDINPLLVLPEGEGAIAVDAYVHLRNEMERQFVL